MNTAFSSSFLDDAGYSEDEGSPPTPAGSRDRARDRPPLRSRDRSPHGSSASSSSYTGSDTDDGDYSGSYTASRSSSSASDSASSRSSASGARRRRHSPLSPSSPSGRRGRRARGPAASGKDHPPPPVRSRSPPARRGSHASGRGLDESELVGESQSVFASTAFLTQLASPELPVASSSAHPPYVLNPATVFGVTPQDTPAPRSPGAIARIAELEAQLAEAEADKSALTARVDVLRTKCAATEEEAEAERRRLTRQCAALRQDLAQRDDLIDTLQRQAGPASSAAASDEALAAAQDEAQRLRDELNAVLHRAERAEAAAASNAPPPMAGTPAAASPPPTAGADGAACPRCQAAEHAEAVARAEARSAQATADRLQDELASTQQRLDEALADLADATKALAREKALVAQFQRDAMAARPVGRGSPRRQPTPVSTSPTGADGGRQRYGRAADGGRPRGDPHRPANPATGDRGARPDVDLVRERARQQMTGFSMASILQGPADDSDAPAPATATAVHRHRPGTTVSEVRADPYARPAAPPDPPAFAHRDARLQEARSRYLEAASHAAPPAAAAPAAAAPAQGDERARRLAMLSSIRAESQHPPHAAAPSQPQHRHHHPAPLTVDAFRAMQQEAAARAAGPSTSRPNPRVEIERRLTQLAETRSALQREMLAAQHRVQVLKDPRERARYQQLQGQIAEVDRQIHALQRSV